MSAVAKKPVGAVASSVKILRFLGNAGRPCRLTEIARETELLPSTCLAILHTLADAGFAMRQADTKTYTLGYGALDLARSILRSDLTIQAILPHLQIISDRYDVTTTVWRRVDDADVMFVSVVSGARSIRLEADFGCRTPIMNAAIGRIMALESGLDIKEVERRFWEINWSSDLDFERFMREAHIAKQAGWAYDKGDFNPRLLSIAVAAPTTAGLVDRGLTATMFVDQHDFKTLEVIAADLNDVARRLLRV